MTLITPIALQAPLIDAAHLADVQAALGEAESDMLLGLMIRDIDFRVKLIVAAVASNEIEKARTEAHCLRGAAEGIGARRLAQSCDAVEYGATHRLPELSAALDRCGGETIAAISIARSQRGMSRV